MNCLDHQSNLVSNQEASLAMGPFYQGRWRFIGNQNKGLASQGYGFSCGRVWM